MSKEMIETFIDKYLPLSGTVGGIAAGIVFLDEAIYTGSGWFFILVLFAFFYAVFYYRWVTDASISPRGREE